MEISIHQMVAKRGVVYRVTYANNCISFIALVLYVYESFLLYIVKKFLPLFFVQNNQNTEIKTLKRKLLLT